MKKRIFRHHKCFYCKWKIFYFLLQVIGENSIIIGIISRRPKSIESERTIFEKYENPEKLPIGPMLPNAGPMLLTQEMAAVIFVSKLNPSTDIAKTVAIISTMYMVK